MKEEMKRRKRKEKRKRRIEIRKKKAANVTFSRFFSHLPNMQGKKGRKEGSKDEIQTERKGSKSQRYYDSTLNITARKTRRKK